MIFMAGNNAYSLVHEYKNGWNPEVFRERYSDVLDRFDYIVGDWGYNQLRLRGFYRDGHPRAGKEFGISNFVDYINEYCNFGCAHFVLAKLDSSAIPPDAEIVKEETPEATVALSETGGQAAETAAAWSGPIMRWPLKERAGGPARVPNVTVSAVARAAAEAERRNANQHQEGHQRGGSGTASSGRGGYAKNNQENGGGANRQGRSYGGDRRPQGQSGGQAPNKPHNRGGNRPNNQDPAQKPKEARHEGSRFDGARKEAPRQDGARGEGPRKETPRQEGARNEEVRNNDGPRGDNRWQGKSRRRKSFGGKPVNRTEGAARPDSGASKSSD